MPINRGQDTQGCYYRYGHQHKYYYTCGDEESRKRAYDKSREQEIAIGEFQVYDKLLKLFQEIKRQH